jgi:hypothetical protein
MHIYKKKELFTQKIVHRMEGHHETRNQIKHHRNCKLKN